MRKRKDKYYAEESNYVDYNNYGMNSLDMEIIEEKEPLSRVIRNTILLLIIAAGIMIAIDIICVTKYNKGPYFAIRTKIYDDGGTQEFKGLGYKVIKYNQETGRKDIELGSWKMTYSATPIEISASELANELKNNLEQTKEKYEKKVIKTTANIYQINNKSVILQYKDTLKIKCSMTKKISLNKYKEKNKVTIIGTIKKVEENSNIINMNNCSIR